MQLTSLSWLPYRPCLLLRLPSTCILLDCTVDLSTLNSFLPSLLSYNSRLSNLPLYQNNMSLPYLKKCGEHVLVDGPFEFHPVSLLSVAVDTIDVILVSNWMSILALPFFTERADFRAAVYAAEPTIQIGKLMMEELIEYVDRVDKDPIDKKWKQPNIFSNFPNLPCTDPREWKLLYSYKEMESSLAKIQRICFRQNIDVNGSAVITAYSSGYAIGSCNWVIRTENDKIAYMSETSSRISHTKAAHFEPLRNSDALILTSVCRFPEHKPETSVCSVFAVVVETLKRNGCVLLPIAPAGVLYDLLECISLQMDQNSVAVDVPIYFISPVAKSTLAYSNIYAEWLSEKKQNMVYIPDEPFAHQHMVRSGRLKVYDTIFGSFCRQMRTPCVLFTGHPSLRIGDAVHFLEMWGNDSRNAVIMTDPDYPLQNVYGPFQNLAIRAYFFPIETRLDHSQLNPTIMPDLAPQLLLMPEQYSLPPPSTPQLLEYAVAYSPHMTFRYGDTLNIPSVSRNKDVKVHPDLLSSANLHGGEDQVELGACNLRGYLSVYDNIFRIQPESAVAKDFHVSLDTIRPNYVGRLTSDVILRALAKVNIDGKLSDGNSGFTIKIELMQAEIQINKEGLRTKIACSSKENRLKLVEIVTGCLQTLC